MKIIKRIPHEAYAYTELHFDTIQEYREMYPKFIALHKKPQPDLPEEKSAVAGVNPEDIPF